MNRLIYSILFVFAIVSTQAQSSTIFVVSFFDKPHADTSTSLCLSDRAIQKYASLGIQSGKENVSIFAPYVDSVLGISNAHLLTWSKWFNFIVIESDSQYIETIRNLSFVYDVSLLHEVKTDNWLCEQDTQYVEHFLDKPQNYENPNPFFDSLLYGLMYHQIAMHNGHILHQKGFLGQNMLIAVLDGGFSTFDTSSYWSTIRDNRIICAIDVTKDSFSIYENTHHGTDVLSLMATNDEYTAIGTAPEADFVLIKTECSAYERRIEEFFLIRGLEIADSMGVDVINISLGYSVFDDIVENHDYIDLNGYSSPASLAITQLARKATIVAVAAGNEGTKDWKYILIPSDAQGAISVAAIDSAKNIANFSSHGYPQIVPNKPDVVAMGKNVYIIDTWNNLKQSNGTSFATPIISGLTACLWQAFPKEPPLKIKQAILQSADKFPNHDVLYGYGIPDFWKAYQILAYNTDIDLIQQLSKDDIAILPTLVRSQLCISLKKNSQVAIIDMLGRKIVNLCLNEGDNYINVSDLSRGMYIVEVVDDKQCQSKKIIKQ